MNNFIFEMIQVNAGDDRRIEHALRVHSYCVTIANNENLTDEDRFVIETAAILHDIGIKNCEKKYNSTNGQLQQTEGFIIAKNILEKYQVKDEFIEQICYIISKHHTYKDIDNKLHQILIEADLIVNALEGNITKKAFLKSVDILFKTKGGLDLAENNLEHIAG